MNRGIRQGDPACGYLFNSTMEPLANLIKHSRKISGITLHNGIKVRLSQYADDSILFLDGKLEIIANAISEIKKFSSVSGLQLNIDKTKCLPIGSHAVASQSRSTICQ